MQPMAAARSLLQQTLQSACDSGAASLDEPTGKSILQSFGVEVPLSRVLGIDESAAAVVGTLTPPFALKVISSQALHKSDVGGVRLGLRTSRELDAAISEMRTALQAKDLNAQGWLIEEMAAPGVEVVVGGVMDPEFGPMIMAGLGGVFVEVLKDVAFRICPITEQDAHSMIRELRGAPLLHGARGRTPVSVDAIVDVLVRLGGEHGLLMQCAELVAEVDINPLIVSASRAVAVDARFVLRPTASIKPAGTCSDGDRT